MNEVIIAIARIAAVLPEAHHAFSLPYCIITPLQGRLVNLNKLHTAQLGVERLRKIWDWFFLILLHGTSRKFKKLIALSDKGKISMCI